MSAETEAIGQKLRASQNDYLNRLLGKRMFPDTGRIAGSAGETADSYLGAPARQAVSELQDGNVNLDALRRVWGRVGQDPRNAPTGVDIASKATSNPYLGAALATATDVGAQVPVGLLGKATGLIPGVSGILKGVKEAGNVADASELFKARGEAPPSPDTKIAQMYGQTGEVVDALKDSGKATPDDIGRDGLVTRARLDQKNNMNWRSAYDNPKNATPSERMANDMAMDDAKVMDRRFADDQAKVNAGPQTYLKDNADSNVLHPMEEFKGPGKKSAIPSSITDSNGPDTFWHDVNDHSYTDQAKKALDSLDARGIPEEDLAKAQDETKGPWVPDGKNKMIGLPNFQAKPTGVIGEAGYHSHSGPDMNEPFPWADGKFGSGMQLLQRHNGPATINTSSDLIGRDDYISAIPKGSNVNMYYGPQDKQALLANFPANPSNLRLDSAADKLEGSGIKVNRIPYEGEENVVDLKDESIKRDRQD